MIVKICLKKYLINIKAHLIYRSKDFTGGMGPERGRRRARARAEILCLCGSGVRLNRDVVQRRV